MKIMSLLLTSQFPKLFISHFSLLLFKSQLLRKLYNIINAVNLIYIIITCNYIYICNQIAVYRVNEKANLHMVL